MGKGRNHYTLFYHFTSSSYFHRIYLHSILKSITSPLVLYAFAGLACTDDLAPGCLG